MVDSGNAKNCILRYNSNGLELPSKLFDLWRHFKSVKFNFSIDNLFEKNDYIRYPSKWNDVLHNLQILDNTDENVTVNIACAVQLLNVLDLVEFVEWKHQQEFKKINVSNGAGMIGLHLVYFPSYLNVRCLPKSIKDIAANRIIKFVESQNNNQEFLNDPMGRNRWLGLVKYMQQEDWSHKIPMLQEYLARCDITRGTDYRTTFPELKDLL